MSERPTAREKAVIDAEREQDSQRRLELAVRKEIDAFLPGTKFCAGHPELGLPDVSVRVYFQLVEVYVCLNGDQVKLLPLTGRDRDLRWFTEELRSGLEAIGKRFHLPMIVEPGGPLGHSGAISVLPPDILGGYHAVLRRRPT
jgi:hypothetical protein